MAGVARGFGALRHPNYRLYFAGQTVSLVGTWMQIVGQAWLVLQLTNSATDLGIVSALQLLPMLFIGSFGGAFADRMPKQRLIIATQVSQMLLAFAMGLLVSTHVVQIWHVYVLAMLLGISSAFDIPTRQAFAIEMVGRDDLMNAVALNSMMYNSARIVGPGVAGVLISLVGVTSSFYVNGVSFLFVIAGLLLMRPENFFQVEPPQRLPLRRSMAEGFRYVRGNDAVRTVVLLVGVFTLCATNTNVLVPLFAENVLHIGAAGLGVLFSAMGAGSIVSGLVLAFSQRARWSRLLAGACGIGVSQLGFAVSRNYALSIVLIALLGFSTSQLFTATNTSIQHRVPDRLRGRVMGIYMTVNQGSQPFGNLASGAIAAAFGAPAAMASGAIAALGGTAVIGSWMFAHRHTADFRLSPDELETLALRDEELPEGTPLAVSHSRSA